MHEPETLHIAEILFDSGEIQYRYARHLSMDGKRWIRHGLFLAFHKNGLLASEGHYTHGFEDGIWRNYHDNGQLAAEGRYRSGKEIGIWRTWNRVGTLEGETRYEDV